MVKAFYGLIIRPTSIHIQPFVKNNYGLLQQKFSCFGKFTNVNLKKILFVVFFSSANSLSVSPQIAIMQCTQKQQSYILWFQNITFFLVDPPFNLYSPKTQSIEKKSLEQHFSTTCPYLFLPDQLSRPSRPSRCKTRWTMSVDDEGPKTCL